MAEKSIEEKVKDIIVEQLGVNPEQVTPQASFIEDLGADSLDIVELVMAFEEEFGVEVPFCQLWSWLPKLGSGTVSRGCAQLHALQFLPDSSDLARDASYGSGD